MSEEEGELVSTAEMTLETRMVNSSSTLPVSIGTEDAADSVFCDPLLLSLRFLLLRS